MTKLAHPLAFSAALIWLGFIGAISFMEAWLKFQAPGITISLGLGIGQLVFRALNKVEWVLAVLIIANLIYAKGLAFNLRTLSFCIAFSILLLQTFWLLPVLDSRAIRMISGETVSATHHHWTYIALEVGKAISLILFAIKQLTFKSTIR